MVDFDYNSIFPIEEYYRKVVIPINPRKYYIGSSGKMVCPLHNDINPSLGVSHGKLHCFGCDYWGDIVKFHRNVSYKHLDKRMTYEESKKDLCRIFDVDYKSLPSEEELVLDREERYFQGMKSIEEGFDISDYREMFLKGKMKGKSVAYFNTLLMIMIDSTNTKNGKDK